MTTEVIDLKAEEIAVHELLSKLFKGWDKQDVTAMTSLLSEDAIFYGNGPSEVYNKEQIAAGWSQMLELSVKLELISEPVVRIAPDGNSAHAIHQYYMKVLSKNIPFRNGYFLIKENEDWVIYNCNTACIVNDEDFPKLDKALSQ